jgi:hypothetical protein
VIPLHEALAFLPERRLEPAEARRAGHGVAVPGEATGVVRLTDGEGLIALAEPGAEQGTLKPIVVLRPEGIR